MSTIFKFSLQDYVNARKTSVIKRNLCKLFRIDPSTPINAIKTMIFDRGFVISSKKSLFFGDEIIYINDNKFIKFTERYNWITFEVTLKCKTYLT